jgi:hypothetical protein
VSDTIQPPTDALMWLRRGLRAVHAGDRMQGWRCFETAHDADSNNVVVLLWLAWLSPSRGESLTFLSRALELDPHNEQAHAGIRWARRHAFPSDAQSPSPQHIPSAALEGGPGQRTVTDSQDDVREVAERADGQRSFDNSMHV